MSRTIDEKIVEMRFDNKDFEKNVSESMSTLDKLKSALNFSSVEDSFSGVSSAIDGVKGQFSALETVAMGALMNIGAKIENFVENQVKSLTIEPVIEGFEKYGNKTQSVQMIMNATGKEIGEVSDQLQRLNWYTDETSYAFTEMVASIGKFTSNGIELDKAVTAMEGIANWAGVSGANKQEANRAMYNISQALAGGYMRLQDWKSIENANMATKEFKESVIQMAIEMGTLEEAVDEAGNAIYGFTKSNGAFQEVNFQTMSQTLSEGKWLTNDVLTATLAIYGEFTDELSKVYDDMNETVDITTSEIIGYVNQWMDGTIDWAEAMEATGKSAEELEVILSNLGKEEYALGRKAFAAAQEAKTFEEAIEATKDAVSTAWMNTFEILFGNYEEAKVLWTDLANELWDIFAGPISDMNEVLGEWADPEGLNGREILIDSIKNIYRALRSLSDPIAEAWEKIFPSVDAEGLFDITKRFHDFTQSLILGEDEMWNIRRLFEGIFSVVKLVKDGVGELVGAFSSGLSIGEKGFFEGIRDSIYETSQKLSEFVDGIQKIKDKVEGFKANLVSEEEISNLKEMHPVLYAIVDIFDKLKDSASIIGGFIGKALDLSGSFSKFYEAGGGFAGVTELISIRLKDSLELVRNLIQIWTGINIESITKPIIGAIEYVQEKIKSIQESGVLGEIKDKISDVAKAFEDNFGRISSWFSPLLDAGKSIWNDFVEGIKMLMGFTGGGIESFFDNIKNGIDLIKDFIESSPGLKSAIETFKDVIKIFSDFLAKFLSLSDTITIFREAGGGIGGVLAVISDKLKSIFNLIVDIIEHITGFNILNIGEVISGVFSKVKEKIQSIFSFISGIIQNITGFDLSNFGEAVSSVISFIRRIIESLVDTISGIFKGFKKSKESLEDFGDTASEKISPLKTFLDGIKSLFIGIISVFKKLEPLFSKVITFIGNLLGNVGNALQNAFNGVDLSKISFFDLLNGGIVVAFGLGIKKIIDFVKELKEGIFSPLQSLKKMFDGVTDVLDGVKDCLSAWQKDLQAKTLIKIAAAVAIITLSVIALSGVDAEKLKPSLVAITMMFVELIGAFTAMNKLNGSADRKVLSSLGSTLIEMAAAILIMSISLKKVSDLSWDEIVRGITGLGIALAELTIALNFMPKDKAKGGMTMIEMAAALLIIASAVKSFGSMDWGEIGKGTIAMGIALTEVSAAIILISKYGDKLFSTGLSLVLTGAALKIIASVMKDFGSMSWDEIGRGLTAMGGALAEVAASIILIGKYGKKLLTTSVSLVIAGAALEIIADVLSKFGSMSWDEIGRGLTAMGGALAEVSAAVILIGKNGKKLISTGVSLVIVGAALEIIADVMSKFGSMSWEEIARGLTAMGGAIAEVSAAVILIGKYGKKLLTTSVSLVIVGAALEIIADVMSKLGLMQWDEVNRSTMAMGIGLLEIVVVLMLLGKYGKKLLTTSVSLVIVGAALEIIADALSKFGSMSWEEIARGLTAMGVALAEISVSLIAISNFAKGAILSAASLVVVGAALEIIADVLSKFGSMSWDEIIKSLVVMGVALAEISVVLVALSTAAPLAIAGAAAMLVMSAALLILVPVLQNLGAMSLAEIGTALLGLAGVFLVVGVAGLVLGPISPLIIALAAAIALLGVGVLGVGAGLLAFSAGLTALSAVGTGAIDVLITIITKLVDLIPYLLTKVGEGIVEIVKLIGDNAATIAESFVNVCSAILDAAVVLVPKLAETVITIIDEILKTMAEHLPSIIDSVATCILELLDGIAEYLPDFIQAGVDIVLSLIEGIADALDENAERAKEAFEKLFKAIIVFIGVFLGIDEGKSREFADKAVEMINGLIEGIISMVETTVKAIKDFITSLIDAIGEFFADFKEKGSEILTNIKDGIEEKVQEVINFFSSIIERIINGAKDAVDKAKDIGTGIMDKVTDGITGIGSGVKKAASTVKNEVTNLAESAVELAKNILGIKSPSKAFEVIGEFCSKGFAEGIFDGIPNIEEKLHTLTSSVLDGMSEEDFFDKAKEYGIDFSELFGDGFTETVHSAFLEDNEEVNTAAGEASYEEFLTGVQNKASDANKVAVGVAPTEGSEEDYLDTLQTRLDNAKTEAVTVNATPVEGSEDDYLDTLQTRLDEARETIADASVESSEAVLDTAEAQYENKDIQGPTVTPVVDTSEADEELSKWIDEELSKYNSDMFTTYRDDVIAINGHKALNSWSSWKSYKDYEAEVMAKSEEKAIELAKARQEAAEAEKEAANADSTSEVEVESVGDIGYTQETKEAVNEVIQNEESSANERFSALMELINYNNEVSDILARDVAQIGETVTSIEEKVNNAEIYLDGKTLVGAMVDDIDKALGSKSTLAGRRV